MSPAAPPDTPPSALEETPGPDGLAMLGPAVRIDWRRPPGQDATVDWRIFWLDAEVATGTLTRANPTTGVSMVQTTLAGSMNLSFLPDMTLWCELRGPNLPLTRKTLQVWPAPVELAETPDGCAPENLTPPTPPR